MINLPSYSSLIVVLFIQSVIGKDWDFGCDFAGNDLSNVQIRGEDCGGRCAATPGCSHFTWTQYNGGTCWMKSGPISWAKATRTNDQSMVCGIVRTEKPDVGEGGCFDSLSWSTSKGKLVFNGNNVFHLKGVNYFGLETETRAPHGSWAQKLSNLLDFIKNNKFNAVRLPFSAELVLNDQKGNIQCWNNPETCQMTGFQVMDWVVDELGKRGVLVMLDLHHFRAVGSEQQPLWYNDQYPESKVIDVWKRVLQRYQNKWNVFAIDLKNEPHDGSWGRGNPQKDWDQGATRIIKALAQSNPGFKGLFFVEGVTEDVDTPDTNPWGHFWAENIEGVKKHPIKTGNPQLDARVVYSPHVYGPDVHMQQYFQQDGFENNMPNVWTAHFGFAEKLGYTVVIGEWGGKYGKGNPKDQTWQDAFANYLIQNCLADQFYWCLNENSGDTGGLVMSDWTTPNSDKLNLLKKVSPNPSKLYKGSNGKICFTPGNAANSACN